MERPGTRRARSRSSELPSRDARRYQGATLMQRRRCLVAEHDRDAPRLVGQLRSCAQRDGVLGRLQRDDVHAAGTQRTHGGQRALVVRARHLGLGLGLGLG